MRKLHPASHQHLGNSVSVIGFNESDKSLYDEKRMAHVMSGWKGVVTPAWSGRLEVGQIWSGSPFQKAIDGTLISEAPGGVSRPVMVVEFFEGDSLIRVAPLSVDLDFYVEGETVMLPAPFAVFMAEIFNELPMLNVHGNLGEYRGSVPAEIIGEYLKNRREFLCGKPKKISADIVDWSGREIELCRFLTASANDLL